LFIVVKYSYLTLEGREKAEVKRSEIKKYKVEERGEVVITEEEKRRGGGEVQRGKEEKTRLGVIERRDGGKDKETGRRIN
jgi:hypothetical protein